MFRLLAALLTVSFLATPVFADAPSEYYSKAQYRRFDEDAYVRQLRREYKRFQDSPRLRALKREIEREERRLNRIRSQERLYRPEPRRYQDVRYSAPRPRQVRSRADYREAARYDRYAEAPRPRRYRDDEDEAVRYAELDRQERRTREVTRTYCMPTIVGHGVPRTAERRARESALKAWGRVVDSSYGKAYINPNRARNAAYICDPDKSNSLWVYECRFRATPCRAEF